jgi:predicted transcriptional regulator
VSGPTVSLLELRDEFAFVRNDANFADVARSLGQSSVKVILVRGKKNKGVAGVISQTHFLKVCATGINPVSTLARNQMQTDLLRLRDDTPLDHAVEAIQEKDPDAVLILSGENKFVGYLSPEDFRQLKLTSGAKGRMGKAAEKVIAAQAAPQDVAHSLDIGDEFVFVRNDAIFSDASRVLAPSHVKVILVRAKKGKGIAGVLTEPEFLKVCATGINPNKTLVCKHMLTDLLRIRSDTPLEEAVKIIGEKDPDAVLVLNAEKKFVGYLSPADYNEAIELLKKKKIEVFDVPAIKPEIAPPPPPPPPALETTLLDELIEEESDLAHTIEDDIISVDASSITTHIRDILSDGHASPVIWQEDGSELIIHCDSVQVNLKDSFATCSLDVECDQTGKASVEMTFCLGSKNLLTNLSSTSEEAPRGPPIIIGRWGPILQDVFWHGLLDLVAVKTESPEIGPKGIGADEGALWISTRPAQEMQIQLIQQVPTQLIGAGDSGGAVI